jgi:hypothetical protein
MRLTLVIVLRGASPNFAGFAGLITVGSYVLLLKLLIVSSERTLFLPLVMDIHPPIHEHVTPEIGANRESIIGAFIMIAQSEYKRRLAANSKAPLRLIDWILSRSGFA